MDCRCEGECSPYSITEDLLRAREKWSEIGRIRTQIYAGFVACLSALTFGMVLGWSNPFIRKLHKQNFELNDHHIWLTSMVPLGASIGTLSKYFSATRFGPRKTLMVEFPFYLLTWILIAFLPYLDVYKAGRFFLGYFGISHMICSQILLHDTVHKHLFKWFRIGYNFFLLFGISLIHSLGHRLSNRDLTLICTVIPVVHFFLIAFMPESPVFQFRYGDSAAEQSLSWYRGTSNLIYDVKMIKKHWEIQRVDPNTYAYIFYSKVVLKSIFIILGLIFFQAFSGYYLFIVYDVSVWFNRNEIFNDFLDTHLIISLLLATNLFWSFIHLGKVTKIRRPLLVSSVLVSMQLTGFSTILLLDYYGIHFAFISQLILVIFLGFYFFFYEMGLGYYPNVLILEYIPCQVYNRAKMVLQFSLWFFIFLLIISFPFLQKFFPTFTIFLFLTLVSYCGCGFCYWFVVEPKDVIIVEKSYWCSERHLCEKLGTLIIK